MTKTVQKANTPLSELTKVQTADPSATVVLTGEHGCEATCPSNPQPTNACEEAIRALAHSKWEAAGCPEGDGVDFWLEAEREVRAELSGSSTVHRPETGS